MAGGYLGRGASGLSASLGGAATMASIDAFDQAGEILIYRETNGVTGAENGAFSFEHLSNSTAIGAGISFSGNFIGSMACSNAKYHWNAPSVSNQTVIKIVDPIAQPVPECLRWTFADSTGIASLRNASGKMKTQSGVQLPAARSMETADAVNGIKAQ